MPELVLRQAQIAAAALDMNVNEYVVAATSAANATLAQNSPLIAAAYHHAATEQTPRAVTIDPKQLPAAVA